MSATETKETESPKYPTITLYGVNDFNEPGLESCVAVDKGGESLWSNRTGLAFGCASRIPKGKYATTPKGAWTKYAESVTGKIRLLEAEIAKYRAKFDVAVKELAKL